MSPLTPKLYTILRRGYTWDDARADLLAGATVAIVALPLAMALAIASGATPQQGLLTAVVAGFLISALGGSRVQIGGPTGAFIPVVYAVIISHGYDGLLFATALAGVMLIVAALLRLGQWMKYMPQPVITGFTAGIAVIILASQIRDFLGIPVSDLPADLVPKLAVLARHVDEVQLPTLILAGATLLTIVALRRWYPKAPAFLLAVTFASVLTWQFQLPVDTIGKRFGEMTWTWPSVSWPELSFARVRELFPAAFTIAMLAGIESLLSAVVADGMIGSRHRSNAELLAQGIANLASAGVGGLPATGAIARTATNVRSGARSPVAGMSHAVLLALAAGFLGPLLAHVPLASLAAVLVVVAWNMSEHERFRQYLRSPIGDRMALLATFGLTVLVDLTVAIEVGLVIASFTFMHQMARAVEVRQHVRLIDDDTEQDDDAEPDADQRGRLPPGVEVFRVSGPLFFGVANRLDEVFDQFVEKPRAFILRMRRVPMIDASGVHALQSLRARCARHGTRLILSGLQPQAREVLEAMHVAPESGRFDWVEDFDAALALLSEADGRFAASRPAPHNPPPPL